MTEPKAWLPLAARLRWVALFVLALSLPPPAPGQQVTDLAATFRSGQVFLTWNEPSLAASDTVIVFRSRTAITSINEPACIPLARLWPKSAHDVFRNDGSGFIIQDGGPRISAHGLLVHTVYPGEEGDMHYAVAVKPASGVLVTAVTPGENALASPVTGQKVEPIQPVWQLGASGKPAAGAGAGKPIHLNLHAKGLANPTQNAEYVAFPDSSMGWQEGVPFKFGLSLNGSSCTLNPMDATYVRRTIQLDPDNRSNLIWSWWYGYNDKILWPDQMARTGKVVNYTERRVLWMVRWAQAHLKTDANRTYIAGTSMGGCGGFSLGMRYPDVFAAIRIRVPNMFYNSINEYRFTGYCGPLTTLTSEGMSLGDRMNGPEYLKRSRAASLPFLVVSNGRNDGSIPWENVPAAYKALNSNRHGFVAAWNPGDHNTANTSLVQDVKYWDNPDNFHSRFALNKCFPAFSNASSNQDPGTGTSSSGAQTGYMNRNLDWNEPIDTDTRYEVLIKQFSAAVVPAPVTVDVTLRRLQRFRFAPGAVLKAINMGSSSQAIQEKQVVVDSLGLITVPGFNITSASGNRLVITPAPGTRTSALPVPAAGAIKRTLNHDIAGRRAHLRGGVRIMLRDSRMKRSAP